MSCNLLDSKISNADQYEANTGYYCTYDGNVCQSFLQLWNKGFTGQPFREYVLIKRILKRNSLEYHTYLIKDSKY